MAPWFLNFEKCPCVSDSAVHIQVWKESMWYIVIPFFRQVMNDIAIGEKKNMNLPGVKVDLPVLQESGGPGQVFAPECSL